MRSKIIILPLLVLFLISCEKSKKEFQKVYDYYSKPADSLKLKAAKILIDNIGNRHYFVTENQEQIDQFFETIGNEVSIPHSDNIWMQTELRRFVIDDLISKGLVDGSLPRPIYERRSDKETITAELLIENIDYAFKAWKFPWSRDYSFEDFCKYILPYRYGNEPLEYWRKDIFEEYSWIADSLKNATSLEAAVFINKQFQTKFFTSKVLSRKGIKLKVSNQLDAGVFLDCNDQSRLGVSVLRSLGIPSVVATIPKWGNRNASHDMTAFFSLENKWTDFNFAGPVHDPLSKNLVKAPKMYLKGINKYEDVSNILMKTIDLEVNVNADENDKVYLCVFSNLSWAPLYKGKNMKSKVIFEDIGNHQSFMYLVAVKTKDSLKPVSPVFMPDSLGNITYLKPNMTQKFSASLKRKYPGLQRGMSRLKDLIGGEFSIADDKEFTIKKQLYKIDTTLNYRNNIVKVEEQSGKYFRYDFPQTSDWDYDGPAEVSFYSSNQGKLERIKGEYFGSSQLSNEHIKMMTDDNVLSFVRVWDSQDEADIDTGEYIFRKNKEPIWIGVEADSTVTVTHIGICPRNDKNGIYPGMHYELFYWDDTWISLGEKKATSNSITYDGIPENALLWLRNWDEGKEERIFTIVDGEQIWW